MYAPNYTTPVYKEFDLDSMRSLVTGSGYNSVAVTETAQALHAFLESLPGAQEDYKLLGSRGTLWISPNLGDVVKDAISSALMYSPPRLPFTLWWNMLKHQWTGNNNDGGTYLGNISGYALLTGAASIDTDKAVLVAVPNTFDYPTIRSFVEHIVPLQMTPLLALTASEPLSKQNGYAIAFEQNKPLSVWGDSITGGIGVAAYRQPDETPSLKLSCTPLTPLHFHYNQLSLPSGSYTVGLKTGPCSSVNGSLEVKLASDLSSLVSLSVELDQVTLTYQHDATITSVTLYSFAASEQASIVLSVSWATGTLSVSAFVPGSGNTAYTQVHTFSGTRVDQLTDMKPQVTYSTLSGADNLMLRGIYVWPASMTVGRAIDRLNRM